ncbi:MAG: tail fiber domain-containing protein [Planctomycetota bacterium]|nr:MAG: tail fiber domain-containing protein [Planctomycetota bacterium]
MKSAGMLTILVLALGLVLCRARVSEAQPMGSAFSYQGHLYDANRPANGLYDFQFKLYDDANVIEANQVGNDVNKLNIDVSDAFFWVDLNFGNTVWYDGTKRWLETSVRPSPVNEPCDFIPLGPPVEITAVPYAITTRGIYVDGAGNVGISTTAPTEKLHVNGDIKVNNIRMNNSDITDNGSIRVIIDEDNDQTDQLFSVWKDGPGGTELLRVQENGHVGIGTPVPTAKLAVLTDSVGSAVYGLATATGAVQNYGGYFAAMGDTGRAVYGDATGYFGKGVLGEATGAEGRGVEGKATSSTGMTYGGHFSSDANSGRAVYGRAGNSEFVENYGGYFEAAGGRGRGVYGYASNNTMSTTHYGGFFKAIGDYGVGVFGTAVDNNGIGVEGNGGKYDFYASGTGTDYGSPSSIRWKKDVRAIDEALGKVVSLRGVYFTWDAEHGGGHDVGMIAEEVGEVLPEIVDYEEDGMYTAGMDYSKLTPLLVEAVKALKNELDEREKQDAERELTVERLLQENEALSKRLAGIESQVEQLAQQRKELNNEAF